jgi:hypothetical protein
MGGGKKTMPFNKTLFEPLVNKTFTMHIDAGQSIELRLANISSQQISPNYESFTLNFDPPAGAPAMPDNSYMMETKGFGPTMIHLSVTHAGMPDPAAYYYEAVFNVFMGQNPPLPSAAPAQDGS